MDPTLLLLSFLLYEAASEPVVVRVEPEQLGQDVTLKCQAGDIKITAVEWTRRDLGDPEYVLFYRPGARDGLSDPDHQHSSFRGRVQLVDGELKTGDVSLILKNVSRDDNGTYECRVATPGSRRRRGANIDSEPISIIQLQMTENQKGDNDRQKKNNNNNGDNTNLLVGLGVGAGVLACLGAVGLFLVVKSKRERYNQPGSSADEETGGDSFL